MTQEEAKNLRPGDQVRTIGSHSVPIDVTGRFLTVEYVINGGQFVSCSFMRNGEKQTCSIAPRDIVLTGLSCHTMKGDEA